MNRKEVTITFSGMQGAGKTVLCNLIDTFLTQQGYNVLTKSTNCHGDRLLVSTREKFEAMADKALPMQATDGAARDGCAEMPEKNNSIAWPVEAVLVVALPRSKAQASYKIIDNAGNVVIDGIKFEDAAEKLVTLLNELQTQIRRKDESMRYAEERLQKCDELLRKTEEEYKAFRVHQQAVDLARRQRKEEKRARKAQKLASL